MAFWPRLRPARVPRSLALTLAVACWPLACGVPAQAQEARASGAPNAVALPALGDSVGQDLSPMAERRLGDRIMRSIRRDPDVIDDPLILSYVEEIWEHLLKAARQRGEIGTDLDASHAWEPFLVRDKTVNAFALPGGYIGVHLGLLAMTTSQDELASVLAHELSHVTQRHIARMMGQQARQSWVSLASMVLGILAASRNPAAAQAMIYGGQAVAIQGQLNFSRDMEREADRVGFGVLSDAGFEPAGMALMFSHLEQASRLNDDGSFPYLRTHPLTTERIGEAQARLGIQGWHQALSNGPASDSSLAAWHALMAARARVLTDTRSDALHTLATAVPAKNASSLQAVSTLYAAAVAQQRTRDLVRAQQTLQQARLSAKLLPPAQQGVVERVVAYSQVDMLLDAGQAAEAARTLSKLSEAPRISEPLSPRPDLLLRARVALAQHAAPDMWQDAAYRLQTHVSDHPGDASAWALLSELWQHLNQPLRAIRAEAEAVAALGDLPGAIDRIQGAVRRFRQPDAADVIELSVMDARLKAWQRQQREDMRDEAAQ